MDTAMKYSAIAGTGSFLPERVGDAYSIRGWLFFGERGYAYRLYSNCPVVKAGNITHFDILDGVPDELQAFRDTGHPDVSMADCHRAIATIGAALMARNIVPKSCLPTVAASSAPLPPSSDHGRSPGKISPAT